MYVTPLPQFLPLTHAEAASANPLTLLSPDEWSNWWSKQSVATQQWLTAQQAKQDKKPSPGTVFSLPDADNASPFLAIIENQPDLWSIGHLPYQLPEGTYRLHSSLAATQIQDMLLGWGMGSYRFSRYKKPERQPARLLLPEGVHTARLNALLEAIFFARDLINMPANDMLPSDLEAAAKVVMREGKAKGRSIVGDALLKEGYPVVHAVGKASTNAPRLIEFSWGNKKHPKVTLVGKGVCFDSGGLNLKPGNSMALMKKDMGGAAIVLGLALAIMRLKLPVRLHVFVPAVENAVSGNAFRPGDVLDTRKGSTVEISNTDAEGRLILCDPLFEGDREEPDVLIDIATLTGAARIALGTDIPALFSNNPALAQEVSSLSLQQKDPLWPLPLWDDYRPMLDSNIADINHATDSSYAGAITAALYLKHFVERCPNWLHMDVMAWNTRKRAGRPMGGEAMGLRTLLHWLERRYPHAD